MSQLYIHIGYPKTATTTLQRHLYPNHPQINYLGKFIPSFGYRDQLLAEEMHKLISVDQIRYQGVDTIRELVRNEVESTDCPVTLISSENLAHIASTDMGVVAQRLREAFYPCKLIVTIREQLDLLRSFYSLHGRFGQYLYLMRTETENERFPLSMNRWLELSLRAGDRSVAATLYFNDLLQYYENLFGDSSVGVFLYEELANESDAFVNKLSAFMGIDATLSEQLISGRRENTKLTQRELRKLTASKLFRRDSSFDGVALSRTASAARTRPPRPAKIMVDESWISLVREQYRESNRLLAQRRGLNLEQHGYSV